MSMSADLRDRLKAAVGAQVYRDEIPTTITGKRVRLQVVSDPRPFTYDGDQATRETSIQADCMAGSSQDAEDLAEAVIAAASPGAVVNNTKFTRAFVDGLRTYSDRSAAGVTTFVTSLDLRVWHQPAA